MPPILKRKEPPPFSEQKTVAAPPRDIPGESVLNHERMIRIKPEVDNRLTAFMAGNPDAVAYYTKLVQENPTHAVRTIMLPKMFRFEAEQRMRAPMAPAAREWFDQQNPDVQQRIVDRIAKVQPYYRETATVRIIAEEKAKLDFKPAETARPRLSLG